MVGSALNAGDFFGEVESTKSVSELHAPVSGTVASANDELETEPEKLNTDLYGEAGSAPPRVGCGRTRRPDGRRGLQAFIAG